MSSSVWAAITKVLQASTVNNFFFSPHSSKDWMFKIKVLVELVSSEGRPLLFLTLSSVADSDRALQVSFYEGTNLIHEGATLMI